MNDIIVIDSDEEDDRKLPAQVSKQQSSQVISLLDSSDDDGSSLGRTLGSKKRKSKSKTHSFSDREIASQLQSRVRQESKRWLSKRPKEGDADRLLAERLQQQENPLSKQASPLLASPSKELKEMTSSTYGKAILAVQEIIAFVTKTKTTHPILSQYNVDTVAQDDMVFLAKQMLDLREEFKAKKLPYRIDIGYHYTNASNMAEIRTNGLLSKADRESRSVKSNFNGSVFGDGIYTAENPTAFQHFGEVGLLVGRLQGKSGK